MANENQGKTLWDLISGFFRRDIAYVLSGVLFCILIDYFRGENIILIGNYLPINSSPNNWWIEVIVLFLSSYFLGFLLSEIGDFFGIIYKRKTIPLKYSALIEFQRIASKKKIKSDVWDLHERNVGLMHIGASIGMSLIMVLIIDALRLYDKNSQCHLQCWMMMFLIIGTVFRWSFKRYYYDSLISSETKINKRGKKEERCLIKRFWDDLLIKISKFRNWYGWIGDILFFGSIAGLITAQDGKAVGKYLSLFFGLIFIWNSRYFTQVIYNERKIIDEG